MGEKRDDVRSSLSFHVLDAGVQAALEALALATTDSLGSARVVKRDRVVGVSSAAQGSSQKVRIRAASSCVLRVVRARSPTLSDGSDLAIVNFRGWR